MDNTIIVALIGAAGAVVAAIVATIHKSRKADREEEARDFRPCINCYR